MSSTAFTEPPGPMPNSLDDWPPVWAYVLPAVDHVMRSTSNADDGSPPKISMVYSMGIYTAIYNYGTSGRFGSGGTVQSRMAKIRVVLDQHCCKTALQLLSEAPEDPSELMRYVIGCFDSLNARASVVAHWFTSYDKCYVASEVAEGRGWLRVAPEDAARIKEKQEVIEGLKRSQLKQWGLREGSTKREMDIAEARAEAGTSPDQTAKVGSIALRRFRSTFIEPLLGVGEGGKQEGGGGIQSTGAQGKLGSAIEKALESVVRGCKTRSTSLLIFSEGLGCALITRGS